MILDFLTAKRREPAECIIRVGSAGQEIADLYPFLTEVTVDASRAEPTVATITFESRRDEQGKWLVQDDGRLAPWEPIVIEAAFGSVTEEVMRGYIREVRADYPEDAGSARVTVECRDDSLALDREHVREVWGGDAPTADQVIVPTILGKYGLAPDPANGSGQTGLVINQDATDIEFLRRRAEANGYDLLFREGMAYFGPMRLDAEPQATIMVYAGEDTSAYRFSVRDDGHQAEAHRRWHRRASQERREQRRGEEAQPAQEGPAEKRCERIEERARGHGMPREARSKAAAANRTRRAPIQGPATARAARTVAARMLLVPRPEPLGTAERRVISSPPRRDSSTSLSVVVRLPVHGFIIDEALRVRESRGQRT